MKTFKPTAKMSHGGHYCWGGKVMKKAEGGDVKKVMDKDKDRLEGLSEDSKKSMGLPISVYDKGKYDPKASRKIMNENFEEGLRQEREEFGKKMKDEYGDTRDYSFKFPSESYNSDLPKGRSYKTKATEGMKRGGSVKTKVNAAGNYTKPGMRKALFNRIKASNTQGTKAGQWSARKAQLLAKQYKAKGGGYRD